MKNAPISDPKRFFLEERTILGTRPGGKPTLVRKELTFVERNNHDRLGRETLAPRPPRTPNRELYRGTPEEDLALVERKGRLSAGTTAELRNQILEKSQQSEGFMSLSHFDEQTRLTLRRMRVLGKSLAEDSPNRSNILAYTYLEFICETDESDTAEDTESEREYAEALQEADANLIRAVAKMVREEVFTELNIDKETSLQLDRLIVSEIVHGRTDHLKALLFQGIQDILRFKADDLNRRSLERLGLGTANDEYDVGEFDIEDFQPPGTEEKMSEHTREMLAKLLGDERAAEIIGEVTAPEKMHRKYGQDLSNIFGESDEDSASQNPANKNSLPTNLTEDAIQSFWDEMDREAS